MTWRGRERRTAWTVPHGTVPVGALFPVSAAVDVVVWVRCSSALSALARLTARAERRLLMLSVIVGVELVPALAWMLSMIRATSRSKAHNCRPNALIAGRPSVTYSGAIVTGLLVNKPPWSFAIVGHSRSS
jgi:hypothetical protein